MTTQLPSPSPAPSSPPSSSEDRARLLRSLQEDSVLVLPNAWDAGSAAVIAAAGARAIATTSGGVSWSLGRPDGEHLGREEMAEAIRRIVAAVDVPVTADIEGGYGPAPEDVAATVRAVVAAGAVGINLEDSLAVGGPLHTPEAQAARLRAARRAAEEAGLPSLVINARTDVHLFALGDPAHRPDDVLTRAAAYASAGADSLFVPGLLDLDALRHLTQQSPLPINALTVPGGPTVLQLTTAGVRRISLGTTLAHLAYATTHHLTTTLLTTGTLPTPTPTGPNLDQTLT